VYASGKWMKTATPFISARDPDTRLYNSQNLILEYLNKVGLDNDVIFKTSNTPGLNENIFYKENIQITDSIPFTTLLKDAKLVILDAPGTTCLETCSTEVPLFVLTGRSRCYKHATKLLRKRAVLASNTDDLIKYIEEYLLNGTYRADIHNNEFFIGYGGTTNINEVKKNALSALQQVVSFMGSTI
jgi:spore coat polysaccharide biosynthesis predicted glycosyltransferase SpsG